MGGPGAVDIETLAACSIGVGDGTADGLLTRVKTREGIIDTPGLFVGPQAQFDAMTPEQRGNMRIKPYGAVDCDGEWWGADVTTAGWSILEQEGRLKPLNDLLSRSR